MDPHRPFSNSIVKGYSGEDTERGAFWENNTVSKLIISISIFYEILRNFITYVSFRSRTLKNMSRQKWEKFI